MYRVTLHWSIEELPDEEPATGGEVIDAEYTELQPAHDPDFERRVSDIYFYDAVCRSMMGEL